MPKKVLLVSLDEAVMDQSAWALVDAGYEVDGVIPSGDIEHQLETMSGPMAVAGLAAAQLFGGPANIVCQVDEQLLEEVVEVCVDEGALQEPCDAVILIMPEQDWQAPNALKPYGDGTDSIPQTLALAALIGTIIEHTELFVFVPFLDNALVWLTQLPEEHAESLKITESEHLSAVAAIVGGVLNESPAN